MSTLETARPAEAPPRDQILTNALVVLEDRVMSGTCKLEAGRIADISAGESRVPGAIDLEGAYLIPGLVDLHTDNLEKHFTPRPGVNWHPVAAAVSHDAQVAGTGITTVFDSLALIGGRNGFDRKTTLKPMVSGVKAALAAGALRADHLIHLRCEVTDETLLDLLEPFIGDPLVRFYSVMDHTPGQRQFSDIEKWREIHAANFGFSRDELDRIIEKRRAVQATMAPHHLSEVARIAREGGIPLASHDDETPDHVAEAAALGIGLSEFPTTTEAARAARAAGMHVLMGAPNLVRGGSHSGNVAAADLARDGLVDVFASDYMPAALLHAAFLLHAPPFDWPLPKAIATVTGNPADAARLGDRGRIAVGLRADLVQVIVADGLPLARRVWREGHRVA